VTSWDSDDFAKSQNRHHAIKASDGLMVQVNTDGVGGQNLVNDRGRTHRPLRFSGTFD